MIIIGAIECNWVIECDCWYDIDDDDVECRWVIECDCWYDVNDVVMYRWQICDTDNDNCSSNYNIIYYTLQSNYYLISYPHVIMIGVEYIKWITVS